MPNFPRRQLIALVVAATSFCAFARDASADVQPVTAGIHTQSYYRSGGNCNITPYASYTSERSSYAFRWDSNNDHTTYVQMYDDYGNYSDWMYIPPRYTTYQTFKRTVNGYTYNFRLGTNRHFTIRAYTTYSQPLHNVKGYILK